MRHIVFLVGDYHPRQSSNAICVNHVVDELKKRFQVSISCFRQEVESAGYYDLSSRVQYYPIDNKMKNVRLYADKKMYFGGIAALNHLLCNGVRFLGVLCSIFRYINVDRSLIKSFESSLEQIHKHTPIDLLVPVCFPVETLAASRDFCMKNSGVQFLPYLFDSFPDSITLNRSKFLMKLKRGNHKRYVEGLLNHSIGLVAMHSFSDSLSVKVPVTFAEHPLLNKYKVGDLASRRIVSNERIEFLYAGSLNRGIRDPKVIVETLRRISSPVMSLRVKFYTKGDYQKYLRELESDENCEVELCETLPFEKILTKMLDSDILLNISDLSGKQISAKVFTYMSLGKPIINFHMDEEDNTRKILDKYPLGISIKGDEPTAVINGFLSAIRNKSIDFNELSNIYPDATASFTANIIHDMLVKNEREKNIY